MTRRATRTQIAARGFAWTSLGYGVQAGSQLLLLVVLARELSPADFGVVQAALVVIGLGRLLTESIVGPALVQRPTISDRLVRTGGTIAIACGLVTAAVIFVSAPLLASLFNTERFVPVVRVLSISFLIQAIGVVSESLLQRELKFGRLAHAAVWSFVVGYAAVGVVLGLAGAGVWALVGANIAQLAVFTGLLLVFRPVSLRPSFDRASTRVLMHYGGGFTLGRFFNYAALQGDYVVVGSTLSATALGIYGRAYQLLATPAMLLGQVIDRVLFPMQAEIQHDRTRLANQYRRAVSLVAIVMLPLSAFVFILAPEIVAVTLGDRWGGVVTPLRFLSISLLARASYKLSDTLARALGLVYARAARQLAYAVLVVVGALIGQRWGVSGVAAGVAVAVIVNFGLMAHLVLDATGLTWTAFAAAHRRGAALTGVTAAILVPLAALADGAGLSPIVTLAVACAAGAGLLAILRGRRSELLGPDVAWLTGHLRSKTSSGDQPAVAVGTGP
jgi:O-antigen/teichoic acid export membrane protein